MRTYDISRPPELINIGFDGENKWRPRGFNCTNWLQKHPDGIITLWIQPEGVRKAFPVSTTKIENTIVWYPLSEELYPGTGKLQLIIQDGEFIGKSDTIKFEVNKSLVSGGAHPDSQPSWATQIIQDVTEQVNRAEAAVEHYPKIVNGVWYVWDVQSEDFISTGIEAQGADGVSPTVTVTAIDGGHRVTITDADGAHTFDVLDGVGGSGAVKSVNGKTGAVVLDATDVHALPDSTVIPVVPQMATAADMSDWTSGKTVDAAVLKSDFTQAGAALVQIGDNVDLLGNALDSKAEKSEIPTKTSELENDSGYQTAQDVQTAIAEAAELPTGGSTGDFLRKTASGVAWETVPAAESNSFGGA